MAKRTVKRRKVVRKKTNNNKRSGFLLFAVVLIILIGIGFFFRDRFSVLFNTGVSSGKSFFVKKDKEKNIKKENVFSKIKFLDTKKKKKEKKKVESVKKTSIKTPIKKTVNVKNLPQTQKSAGKINNIKQIKKTTSEVEKNKKIESYQKEKVSNLKSRNSYVYYGLTDDTNEFKLVKENVKVTYTNTPLTATINALLKGVTDDNVISHIPVGTRLLSVRVKNNIAYINLSRQFEYNQFGRSSTLTQLKQIVYTATEFSTVESVQFLIEGNLKTYLGGEGVKIDKPFKRSSFS